jgi:hypothetical protein
MSERDPMVLLAITVYGLVCAFFGFALGWGLH